MTEGFVLRAPWYVRERRGEGLRDPRSLRPQIQMYDGTDFVQRLIKDPGASMAFGLDDRYSYPVLKSPNASAKGLAKFVTHELVPTRMRKLYQPSHNRFYVVVVEVFCDAPGLPRAGSHDDITVSMLMRRRSASMQGTASQQRRLARALLVELNGGKGTTASGPDDLDVGDVFFAEEAERERFEQDQAPLIEAIGATVREQAWIAVPGGGWAQTPEGHEGRLPMEQEEVLPMFRLPPRDGCPPDKTRSLWFGLVPTYSADHWTDDDGQIQSKLDDREIYSIRCVVEQPRPKGHEKCPRRLWVSVPTRPFKLAAPLDPDGTKNRTISVTAPDLRRLAAAAGKPRGPGGLRITTPPGSRLGPVDFKAIPGANLTATAGAGICSFAFELFFIVALFLFLLFLPIVVLAFQLWWMLALRFCLPPSGSFSTLETFFATADLGDLDFVAGEPAPVAQAKQRTRDKLDEVLGMVNAADHLRTAKADSDFDLHPDLIEDLVTGLEPPAVPASADAEYLVTPPDPLCAAGP